MDERAQELHLLQSSICRLVKVVDCSAAGAVVDLAWARKNLQDSVLRHDNHRSAKDALAAEEWRRVYNQVDPNASRLVIEIEGEATAAEAAVRAELGESDKEALLAAVKKARDEVFERRSNEYATANATVSSARTCANEAQSAVLAVFAEPGLKEQVDLANQLESYARGRLDALTAPGAPILQLIRV